MTLIRVRNPFCAGPDGPHHALRRRHSGPEHPRASVAVSPDRDIMITAGNDRTAIVWNIVEPTRPSQIGQPLTGHADAVSSVAFSPNGKIVATASWGSDRDSLGS